MQSQFSSNSTHSSSSPYFCSVCGSYLGEQTFPSSTSTTSKLKICCYKASSVIRSPSLTYQLPGRRVGSIFRSPSLTYHLSGPVVQKMTRTKSAMPGLSTFEKLAKKSQLNNQKSTACWTVHDKLNPVNVQEPRRLSPLRFSAPQPQYPKYGPQVQTNYSALESVKVNRKLRFSSNLESQLLISKTGDLDPQLTVSTTVSKTESENISELSPNVSHLNNLKSKRSLPINRSNFQSNL